MEKVTKELISWIIKETLRSGATAAECSGSNSEGLSLRVRHGEIESFERKESQLISLEVFIGNKRTSLSTDDLSGASLKRAIKRAVATAKHVGSDKFNGLETKKAYEGDAKIPKLYYKDSLISFETAKELCVRCEKALFNYSSKIVNDDGVSFSASIDEDFYGNSLGILKSYKSSEAGIMAIAIAKDKDYGSYSDSWFKAARSVKDIDPESVGEKAAERAARMVGKNHEIRTSLLPVIFDNATASTILGSIAESLSGNAIFRRASFLSGKIGESVASPLVTIIDDGIMPGGIASWPYDNEGIPTRKTTVIEKGILKSYLLDIYSARRLGLSSTGNAGGTNNFYLKPGNIPESELIASIKDGVYITQLMGFGIDIVSGDFSQGAAGLLIKDGKIVSPVRDITISGNLSEMFKNIEAVADNLDMRGGISAPSIKISGMVVSGK